MNASAAEKAASEVKCTGCKRLVQLLKLQNARTPAENPGKKLRKQQPFSRARLQHMSSAGRQACKYFAQYKRSNNIQKLARLEENEIILDNEQHEEMSAAVEAVQVEELEKLFQEGEQHGVGSLLKNVWFTDKDCQRKYYWCNNVLFCLETSERHGNRRNMITIHMGKLKVINPILTFLFSIL